MKSLRGNSILRAATRKIQKKHWTNLIRMQLRNAVRETVGKTVGGLQKEVICASNSLIRSLIAGTNSRLERGIKIMNFLYK